jgi:hypothetical protein
MEAEMRTVVVALAGLIGGAQGAAVAAPVLNIIPQMVAGTFLTLRRFSTQIDMGPKFQEITEGVPRRPILPIWQ